MQLNHEYPELPSVVDPLDILVVAPHPDDAELGMGGTISKMIQQGHKVGIVDLTNGEPTPYGSTEKRAAETQLASKHLGVTWRYNLGLPNRFLEATLENRAKLAGLFRLARPRWIFAPFWLDAHPDHIAATELVEAARFWSKLTKCDLPGKPFHPSRIFYYYCIHLKHIPQPAWIMDISSHWQAKADSIMAYRSQFLEGKEHVDPPIVELLREQAGTWGTAIGVRYGEPFASKEPIGLKDLNDLI
ncbi:MAG: bacillithiol biosynthesis deacetylase BshB1 [Pirellula sp.]